MFPSTSILGRAVKRVEDPRFIRGEGGYLDNRTIEGALHMVTVRSPEPHGRITAIETAEARKAPGVVGVYTSADLPTEPVPPPTRLAPPACARPSLATDVVRFAGEIVAVVVAESVRQAVDAAALVWADIEPLPAVADLRAAMADGAPLLFPDLGTNVIHHREPTPVTGLFDAADTVLKATLRNQRVAPVPMEPNNALAYPTPSGLELWMGSQDVFGHRHAVSRALGMERDDLAHAGPRHGWRIRCEVPRLPRADTGGGARTQAGQTGQMAGDTARQPRLHVSRPRSIPGDRDRRHQ